MPGDERPVRAHADIAVGILGADGRDRIALDDRDRVEEFGPRRRVEHAVVVRVEILVRSAREAAHEDMRDVVGVLEEVGRRGREQVRHSAEREVRARHEEQARPADGGALREGDDALDHARAACAVADHEVGESLEARARGARDLDVLVVVRARHVDADLVDHDRSGEAGVVRSARRVDAREGIERADVPLRDVVAAEPRCRGLLARLRADRGRAVEVVALHAVRVRVRKRRDARHDLGPRGDVERAVVVDVELLAVEAAEVAHE